MTGAEGEVHYETEDGNLNVMVHWYNPYIGGNDCKISLGGPNKAKFSVKHLCGVGNEKAHMRFELKEEPSK
jgi:hypothetical protein